MSTNANRTEPVYVTLDAIRFKDSASAIAYLPSAGCKSPPACPMVLNRCAGAWAPWFLPLLQSPRAGCLRAVPRTGASGPRGDGLGRPRARPEHASARGAQAPAHLHRQPAGLLQFSS